MRGLVLLLILANAGLLGWFYWEQQQDGMGQSVDAQGNVSSWRMLSELNEGAAADGDQSGSVTAPEEGGEEQGSPAVASNCFLISGIKEQERAAALAVALNDMGASVTARQMGPTEVTNYLVSIPPRVSSAEASELVKELGAAGLKDFYRVQSGETVNAIALGVFTTQAAAERRQSQVATLGLPDVVVEISEIERTAERASIAFRKTDTNLAAMRSALGLAEWEGVEFQRCTK